MRRLPPRAAALGAFALLLCLLFPGPLFRGRMFFVTEPRAYDILAMGLPFRIAFEKSLKAGSLPLWAPEIYCGYPLHAEGEGSFLHPLSLAASLAFSAPHALTAVTVGSLALAGLLTMLFARGAGISWAGALLAGSCFSLNGFMILKIQHTNSLLALAPTGLLFYGWERFASSGRGWWACAAGAGWALQILAGYPAFAYYGALFSGAYGTARVFQLGGRGALGRWARGSALFLAVGLGLSAAQWMPTLELVGQSWRSQGVSLSEASSYPYAWRDLLGWARPEALGAPWSLESFERGVRSWEHASYMGLIPLLLALAGLAWAARAGGAPRLIALSLAAALALALQTPLYAALWAALPGFSYFRLSSRLLYPALFAAALLAGWGLDLCRRRSPRLPGLAAALVALSLADLWAFGRARYRTVDPAAWLSPPAAAADLADAGSRFGSLGSLETFNASMKKLLSADPASSSSAMDPRLLQPYAAWKELLGMGSALTWGLRGSWTGYMGLEPRRLLEIHNSIRLPFERGKPVIGPESAALLRVQGVERIVAPGRIQGAIELERVYPSIPNGAWLHRLKDPLPRAHVVGRARIVPSEEAVAAVARPGFDPAAEVVLEDPAPAGDPRAQGSPVRWQTDKPTRLELTAAMKAPGYLVLADLWYPGWTAAVDGTPAPILRANGAFRAVFLPAGEHEVAFAFVSRSFQAGAALSLLTLLGLAAAGLAAVRKTSIPR